MRGALKVSVLTEDLSENSLGRAYLLAEILAEHHEVEILGTRFGDRIWPPGDTGRFAFRAVAGGVFPGYARNLAGLARWVDGDVIYAVKPKVSSFGAGLLAKRRTGVPLILDIDDDELAMKDLSPFRGPRELAWDLLHPSGPAATRLMRSLIPRADALTVASRGLQARHGGLWIPHAKDTKRLRPEPGATAKAKAALGLTGERVVMFAGTPRPWKGVHDAADAIPLMRHDAVLVVIGARPEDAGLGNLLDRPRVRIFPPCTLDELPSRLRAADVVVVPQRDCPEAAVQLPSKLLDAMALGKPVVATAVSDIPWILGDDRGIVVPAGDPGALAAAFDRMFAEPDQAARMAERAREWCEVYASYDAVGARLSELFSRLGSHSG